MTNNAQTFLRYAELQIAAEALFDLKTTRPSSTYSGPIAERVLTTGNERSSRFTQIEAERFVREWTVVEHLSNTPTGFSGTLFRNTQTGELVLSFRSTEFADDATRDNQATNVLEIKDKGWAFGQLIDMEAWYASLRATGKIGATEQFTLTGYSLGGHLATAFNLLRQDEFATVGASNPISATYTFNGAGVGKLLGGKSLREVLTTFNEVRQLGASSAFETDAGRGLYQEIKSTLDVHPNAEQLLQARFAVDQVIKRIVQGPTAEFGDYHLLADALNRAYLVAAERDRAASLPNGNAPPQPTDLQAIDAVELDYQLGVLIASRETEALSLFDGVANTLKDDRTNASPPIPNFYDVYANNFPTAVANSQLHYGLATGIIVEDQPLHRGTYAIDALGASGWNVDVKLLVRNFGQNDFGDTHSLVLLVDSLTVQDALARLDPTFTSSKFVSIMRAATRVAAESDTVTWGQGVAEGDALENIVNALARTFGLDIDPLKGDTRGNTWFRVEEADGYHGRDALHRTLQAILESEEYRSVEGRVTVAAVGSNLATQARARVAFEDIVALETLSPFRLTAGSAAGRVALEDLWASSDWSDRYQAWIEDREALDAGNDASTYTDEWIADRAVLAQSIGLRNTQNQNAELVFDARVSADRVEVFEYFESESGESQRMLVQARGGAGLKNQYIAFGNDDANTLRGFDNALGDHLYGGGGNDTLAGDKGNDYLQGDAGADALDGGDGADTLFGGAGADTLDGGTGSDLLRGGEGIDIYKFAAGSGLDTIDDSDGSGRIEVEGFGTLTGAGTKRLADNIWRTEDGQVSYTLAAIDGARSDLTIRFASRPGDVIVLRDWSAARNVGIVDLPSAGEDPQTHNALMGDFGKQIDAETDRYVFAVGGYASSGPAPGEADVINGGASDDAIYGLSGNDGLSGGAGSNFIDGGDGSDLIFGGTGRNVILGGAGNDFIWAGTAGTVDRPRDVDFTPPTTRGVELARGFSWAVYDQGDAARPEILTVGLSTALTDGSASGVAGNVIDGGSGDDHVTAGRGNDVVHGGDDNDVLQGMAGDDVLFGDAGDDRLWGDGEPKAGDFSFTLPEAHGDDTLVGGAGNDYLQGQGGDDALYGGADDDELWGDGSASDTPFAIHGDDYLDGGDGNDRLEGAGRDDVLYGGAGDDRMWGDNSRDGELFLPAEYQGADSLDGGLGNDQLHGGGGNDIVIGGAGNDLLWGDDWYGVTPLDAQGEDHVEGGDGNDQILGGGGADTLLGGDGDDLIYGDDLLTNVAASAHGDDYVEAGAGDDDVHGGGGNDVLLGDAGEDILWGDDGDDVLVGGTGTDLLLGGADDDTYVFHAGDSTINAARQIDFIEDDEGHNTIELPDVDLAALLASTDGRGALVLDLAAGERLGVRNGAAGADFTYRLADGRDYSYAELVGTFAVTVIAATDADGHRVISGGKGDDAIVETSGHATLSGGRGDDTLTGSGGHNTYLYGLGDGSDTLVEARTRNDASGAPAPNRLRFGAGITTSDVHATMVDGRLVLQVGADPADRITIVASDSNGAGGGEPIELFEFADGTVLTHAQLVGATYAGTPADDVLTGGPGADEITGGEGDDLLRGGGGHDRLTGGRGGDTFVLDGAGAQDGDMLFFDTGDGSDQVVRGGSAGNTLHFGAGIAVSDVQVVRLGGASAADTRLLIRYGIGDQIELQAGAAAQIDSLVFADGSALSMQALLASIQPQGTPGADVLIGSSGHDELAGGAGDDMLRGNGGGDRLEGGAGRDVLVGGQGENIYVFGAGSGSDLIRPTAGEIATLRFEGILAADLRASVVGSDLVIATRAGDRVRIEGYADPTSASHSWSLDVGGQAIAIADFVRTAEPLPEATLAARREQFVDQQYLQLSTMGQYFPDAWDSIDDSLVERAVPDAVVRVDEQIVAGQVFRHASYLDFQRRTIASDTTQSTPIYSEVVASARTLTGRYVSLAELISGASGPLPVPDGAGPVYGGSAQNAGRPWDQTGWFIPDPAPPPSTPPQRIIGWTTRTFHNESTTTTVAEARQFFVQGTSADDVVEAQPATGGADVLFRGVIETGDGNDRISLGSGSAGPAGQWQGLDWGSVLPGSPLSYQNALFRPRGLGAWIDAGNGDDVIEGSDANDTLIGGAGNDVLRGGAGADTYFISGSGNDVDRIQDTAAFDWGDFSTPGTGYFQPYYGGDLANPNRDVVEFDADVSLAGLSYRWQPGTSGDRTLELLLDNRFFLAIDYRDQPAPTDREVSLPGIERFRFASGALLSLDQLLEAIPPASQGEHLAGGAGNDQLFATDADTTLAGFDGDDLLYAGAGNDVLQGGVGSDTLYGNGGNDTLQGDAGNDMLVDSSGSNTFVFARGDGRDEIYGGHAAGETGTLRFGADISASDIVVRRWGANAALTLGIAGTDDQVAVPFFYFDNDPNNSNNPLQAVRFADGTRWDLATLIDRAATGSEDDEELFGSDVSTTLRGQGGNDVLHGGGADDVLQGGSGYDALYGGGGNDTLDGGAGIDVLEGGIGSDTYLLSRGSGTDWVWEADAESDDVDIVLFGSDVSVDQLWFRQIGSSLEVSIIGTDDKLVVQGWNSDAPSHPIEAFRTSDGQVLLHGSVHSLVEAMAGFAPPAPGETVSPYGHASSLANAIAAHWQ